MRAKLTAKHPRPASAERAPVRAGSPSARKPVRAAKPVGAGAGARGAAAAKGAAGSGGAALRGKAKDGGAATGRRDVRSGAAGAAKADRPGRAATGGDARGPRTRAGDDSRGLRPRAGDDARGPRSRAPGDDRPPRSRTSDDSRGFRPRAGDDARGPRSRAPGDDRPPRSRTSDDSRGFRPRAGDDARGPRSRAPGDDRPPRSRSSDDSRGFRPRAGDDARGPRSRAPGDDRPPRSRSSDDSRGFRPRAGDDARGPRSRASGDDRPPRSRSSDDSSGFRPRAGDDARGPRSRTASDDRPPRSRPSDDSRGFRPRTADDARGPRSRAAAADDRPPRSRASDDSRGSRSRTSAEDRPPRAGADRNERPRFTRGADGAEARKPYGAARGTDDTKRPAPRAKRSQEQEFEPAARNFARPIKGDYAERQQHSEPEAKRTRSAAPGRPAPRNNDRNHDTDAHTTAPHRERHDAPGSLRLSKLMSELGMCSRREADEWIEKGWVLVDGERIDTLGTKVRPDARIEIDPAAEAAQARSVTILLHKPVGFVSGQAEDGYEPAITLITPANHWEGDRSEIRFAPSHLRQLAPAGRLDIDSTGLLVLTQDGRVAKQLIGGHSEVDKEYLVRVAYGDVETDVDAQFPLESLAQLRHGLELDGVPLKTAMVSWQNGEQLRFVLREGKKRQIRRMCELVGLRVVGLKRVRMGKVALGALPQGQWRYLSVDETF